MILDEIVAYTRERVARMKNEKPLSKVKKAAELKPIDHTFPFEQALRETPISFICEVKRASPSKGIIAADCSCLDVARSYESAGASAISVLTEPRYFLGQDRDLARIARHVNIPVLRKDFIIDAYQLYETKCLGATAVLLITATLDQQDLALFIRIAHDLGLSALVEVHSEDELHLALLAGARIIGINNRNLATFDVDLQTTFRLRPLVPKDRLLVSESGIHSPEQIAQLRQIGIHAVLVGETLMRSQNKKQTLSFLRGDTDDED
jgi:indole-3-glycerol phosphate synthase